MTNEPHRMLPKYVKISCPLTFLAIVSLCLARGQETGGVRGIVVDGKGDYIQNATVELLKAKNNSASYATRSGADGSFHISAIAPGEYTVKVAVAGLPASLTWIRIIAGRDVDLRRVLLGSVDCGQPGILCDDFTYLKGELQLPCIKGVDLLRSSSGSLALLPFRQLDERAVHRSEPNWPREALTGTNVSVYVVIGIKGNVLCSAVTGEQSPTEKAARDAAEQWKFRPVFKNGSLISVIGKIEFQVPQRKGTKTEEACEFRLRW